MSGYLDQYGAGEERRLVLIRNSVIIGLTLIVVGSLLWYLFRTYHQARVTKDFLRLVRSGDFQAAYRVWGCGSPQSCQGYAYQKFLEDWGPNSSAGQGRLHITDTDSCNSGVIITLRGGSQDEEVKLWMEKKGSDALSFSPVPLCPGKSPWAIMMHRTVGRLRGIFF